MAWHLLFFRLLPKTCQSRKEALAKAIDSHRDQQDGEASRLTELELQLNEKESKRSKARGISGDVYTLAGKQEELETMQVCINRCSLPSPERGSMVPSFPQTQLNHLRVTVNAREEVCHSSVSSLLVEEADSEAVDTVKWWASSLGTALSISATATLQVAGAQALLMRYSDELKELESRISALSDDLHKEQLREVELKQQVVEAEANIQRCKAAAGNTDKIKTEMERLEVCVCLLLGGAVASGNWVFSV